MIWKHFSEMSFSLPIKNISRAHRGKVSFLLCLCITTIHKLHFRTSNNNVQLLTVKHCSALVGRQTVDSGQWEEESALCPEHHIWLTSHLSSYKKHSIFQNNEPLSYWQTWWKTSNSQQFLKNFSIGALDSWGGLTFSLLRTADTLKFGWQSSNRHSHFKKYKYEKLKRSGTNNASSDQSRLRQKDTPRAKFCFWALIRARRCTCSRVFGANILLT